MLGANILSIVSVRLALRADASKKELAKESCTGGGKGSGKKRGADFSEEDLTGMARIVCKQAANK